MTRGELDTLVKNSTGIPVPPDGAPLEEAYEWYVAGTLVGGMKLHRGDRDGAVRFARDRFDEDPDRARRARVHDLRDRALRGEIGGLDLDTLAKGPPPEGAPTSLKRSRRPTPR